VHGRAPCLGESVSSDQPADVAAERPADSPAGGSNRFRNLLILGALVLVLNVVAFILVPPFPSGGQPGDECGFPVCFIGGNLEFPPPHAVWQLDPDHPLPTTGLVIGWNISISNTILTMWLVMAVLIVIAFAATRRMQATPGHLQNIVEFIYQSLDDFATGIGGSGVRRHLPWYMSFFLLILFCNWSGLIPPIGKIHELRAPTSDVNVTIGLALVSFAYFQTQGFKTLGVRGYLGKFFPFYEFRNGIGAGAIALFVGLIELLLEFVKPVTLAMRLFGNIYGGEVALGVIIALTVVILPTLFYGLELLLNFVQALIFSILTLMYTLQAVESHEHEEGEVAEEAVAALHDADRQAHGQVAAA
jgi:F-type H+-transporting ATPase subunit a